MTQPAQVRITTRAPHDATIEIDGRDVAPQCRAFTLTSDVHDGTTLTLDVGIHRGAQYHGDAIVRVSPENEQLLVELGWTPPRP